MYNHNNYDHLAIKLYSNFVLPIINITKNEHIKEHNEHANGSKYINRNCLYLMNIYFEKYLELSKDEYSKMKKFIDYNIDTFESILAPIHSSINLYKKCYSNYFYCPCSCHGFKRYGECVCDNCKYKEFCKENNFILKSIVKSYFNVEYIKFFHLLEKVKLNTSNVHSDILANMFLNLYNNSNIDCNEKVEKFIDNNVDIIEFELAPMHDYFDLYKKCYNRCYCSCYNYHNKKVKYIFPGKVHKKICEKIIKLYFSIEHINIFYLLQKEIKLNKNIRNINVLIDIFMNLYDYSNIDCNKKK